MEMEGTMSWFGGPDDTQGMAYDEGLAFWEHWEADKNPHLFLERSKDLAQGVSRRLRCNDAYYIALNVGKTDRDIIHNSLWQVENSNSGDLVLARLVDKGPSAAHRLVDASKAVFSAIGMSWKDDTDVKKVRVREVSKFNIQFGLYPYEN